eukprot:9504181-Pyramimonas_sp.AAC.3
MHRIYRQRTSRGCPQVIAKYWATMVHAVQQHIVRPDPRAPECDAHWRAAVLETCNVEQCLRRLQAVAYVQAYAVDANCLEHCSAPQ